jgi:hypothetical protein
MRTADAALSGAEIKLQASVSAPSSGNRVPAFIRSELKSALRSHNTDELRRLTECCKDYEDGIVALKEAHHQCPSSWDEFEVLGSAIRDWKHPKQPGYATVMLPSRVPQAKIQPKPAGRAPVPDVHRTPSARGASP